MGAELGAATVITGAAAHAVVTVGATSSALSSQAAVGTLHMSRGLQHFAQETSRGSHLSDPASTPMATLKPRVNEMQQTDGGC